VTRYWPWLCAPAVFLLVAGLTVNVPMFDEWTWAPLVLAAHDTTLRIGDLWAQQQAHRSFVPSLLMLGLAQLDGWNVRIEAMVSVLLALATQVLLFGVFSRVEVSRRASAFALGSLLLFSLLQSENWLWGFQMSWFLVNLFVVAVVVLLARRTAFGFVVAVLAAIAASCSLVFGFGAWIAGIVMLLRCRGLLLAWCVLGAVFVACFAIGYHAPRFENGWAPLSSPLVIVQFVLVYLGDPIGAWAGRVLAEIAGVALIAAFAFCARIALGQGIGVRPWFALAAFALTAACFEAIGRAGNGIDAALALRYVTPSTLGWIALVGLSAQVLDTRRWRGEILGVGALVIAGCVAGCFYAYSLSGLQLDAFVAVQHLDRVDDEELSEYTADPQATRALAAQLRAAHLGPYR
jgi:hypothetical protein